jgi:hypothetical protein
MEREASEELHGRRDSDRARVENIGVEEEAETLDDVEHLPSEGMQVDDI